MARPDRWRGRSGTIDHRTDVRSTECTTSTQHRGGARRQRGRGYRLPQPDRRPDEDRRDAPDRRSPHPRLPPGGPGGKRSVALDRPPGERAALIVRRTSSPLGAAGSASFRLRARRPPPARRAAASSVVDPLEMPGPADPIEVDEREPLRADDLEVVAGDRLAPPRLLDAPVVADLDWPAGGPPGGGGAAGRPPPH